MICELPNHGWRRRFAFLPFTLPNGPTKTLVWWAPYWSRGGGYFTEVSLIDPLQSSAAPQSEPQASAAALATDDPKSPTQDDAGGGG